MVETRAALAAHTPATKRLQRLEKRHRGAFYESLRLIRSIANARRTIA